jgi:intein-encoded DNA endonuclease-like protein
MRRMYMAKKTTKKSTEKIAEMKGVQKIANKTTNKATKKASSNKTIATPASVKVFLKKTPAKYHQDCAELVELMSAITGAPPKMWGLR